MTDWGKKENALKLAGQIRSYWREKGYVVTTTIEVIPIKTRDAAYIWTISSDMVNGVPVKRIK